MFFWSEHKSKGKKGGGHTENTDLHPIGDKEAISARHQGAVTNLVDLGKPTLYSPGGF